MAIDKDLPNETDRAKIEIEGNQEEVEYNKRSHKKALLK